ncbi:MAG: carboxypeptidase-like regulatory domain-containing protein [Planctomycetaceae bacterium]|jgi:hypothetical protein|nr:carboxypeptidase-like regulatory domain-containing protein [Planctomycetaceae bacterium]
MRDLKNTKSTINSILVSSIFLMIFLLCSCSPTTKLSGLVQCQGTVTIDGEPVSDAVVLFSPVVVDTSRRAATGRTDARGRFTLTTLNPSDGIAPGEFVVMVTKYEKFGPVPTERIFDPDGIDITPPQEERNVLPERYADKTTTNLKAVIPKSGDLNLLFELKR